MIELTRPQEDVAECMALEYQSVRVHDQDPKNKTVTLTALNDDIEMRRVRVDVEGEVERVF